MTQKFANAFPHLCIQFCQRVAVQMQSTTDVVAASQVQALEVVAGGHQRVDSRVVNPGQHEVQ